MFLQAGIIPNPASLFQRPPKFGGSHFHLVSGEALSVPSSPDSHQKMLKRNLRRTRPPERSSDEYRDQNGSQFLAKPSALRTGIKSKTFTVSRPSETFRLPNGQTRRKSFSFVKNGKKLNRLFVFSTNCQPKRQMTSSVPPSA